MKKNRIAFFAAALLLSTYQLAQANWTLTFSDEFNSANLDTTKWITTYPGGGQTGNTELEWYVPNAFTFPAAGSEGYLQVNTAKQSTGSCNGGTCTYTSGMIDSFGKFSQAYGYFEMRAQLPAGQGAWPAFWLMPYSNPMKWPQAYEIDVFEAGFGGGSSLNPQIQSTFHYNSMTASVDSGPMTASALTSGFHTFAVDWEPGSLTYYVDGAAKYTTTSSVPSAPAYILANYAIGDSSWSMIGVPTSSSDSELTNNQIPMKIDYIRVYQKTSSGGYSAIPGPTPIPTLGGTTDTTAPTASISAPANNASVSGTVSVTASAADNVGVSKVEFYLNGALQGSDTTSPYLYSWNTMTAANGSYTLSAKAYDAAGNVGQSATITVTVNNAPAPDTTPPAAAIGSPANNATLSGTAVVTASASDNIGVTRVEFYQDGTLSSAGNVAPYNFSWNTTMVANGSHTLSARAYDAAGNVGQSASITVTVNNFVPDTTAPVVGSFSMPATSTTLSVPISGLAASDNVAVTGYLVSESSAAPAASAAGWTPSKPASFSFSGSGARTAYVFAKDAAGNVSVSRSATVTITLPDSSAPVLSSFSIPATSTTLSVPISGLSASDNVAVTSYLVSESSNAPAASAAGWTSSKPASFSFAGSGVRTAYAFAKDAAGNVSAGRAASVTITLPDTSAPVTSIASPLSGAKVGSTVTISASATDNVKVVKMALYIDNVLKATDSDNTLAWSWNTRSYARGAHVIKVVSYDAANNTSSKSITVNK